MVHYGHSCLVPIDAMASRLRMLYVFVDVTFDVTHLVACVRDNFPAGAKLALLGTIQFASALHAARDALAPHFPSLVVPQAKPLSPGEVLGCTSPNLGHLGLDAFVFVADGRFHLESVMIHNPGLPAFRCGGGTAAGRATGQRPGPHCARLRADVATGGRTACHLFAVHALQAGTPPTASV